MNLEMSLDSLHHWYTASGALVAELPAAFPAERIMRGLAECPGLVCFDSSSAGTPSEAAGQAEAAALELARFSFLAADPIFTWSLPPAAGNDSSDQLRLILGEARRVLIDCRCPTIPGLPPFQGGLAGLLSFDAGLAHLGVPVTAARPAQLPQIQLGLYDVVFAFDHQRERAWAISQGLPAGGQAARRQRSRQRLEHHLAAVAATAATEAPDPRWQRPTESQTLPGLVPLPGSPGVFSTHTEADYLTMVQAGIDLVRAGDIFQVNLAQQLCVPARCDPLALYRVARRLNPAPFAGFLSLDDGAIVSMSPERFLKVTRDRVWMHPIKGTRRVLASPEADLFAGADLGASEKDRAENVMIVDLVRNDLARVCRPESVEVEALCRLERFRYVQHLVSVVSGRLLPGAGPLDAVLASFPGGSVTGAPKRRACEIISDLERAGRGPYCGTLGYVGFDGAADFNLLIRSFVVGPDEISFSVGGGITVGSDPAAEYAESLHKAEGMLRVLAAFAGEEPA